MPALRIKHPTLGIITHVLRSERVTIGRADDNSIRIPHPSIGKYHAEIVATDGEFRLHSIRSTHPCLVDGVPATNHELLHGCQISFGAVECEFDAHATTTARPLLALQAPGEPPQHSRLENENLELRAEVMSMRRRFDILGSARLTTGHTDHTPGAVASEAIRGLTAERDELRLQATGLRLEVGRLRDELAFAIRERDAARNAAAGLQNERASLHEKIQDAEARVERLRSELIIATESPASPRPAPPPTRPPAISPSTRPAGAAPKPPAPAPRAADPAEVGLPLAVAKVRSTEGTHLSAHIASLGERIGRLDANPWDRILLIAAHHEITLVLEHATAVSTNPLRRIAGRCKTLLASLSGQGRVPSASALRALRHATALLERLLDPSLICAAAELPTAQILAIDDDTILLAAIANLLSGSGVEVSSCVAAEDAMIAIEALRFDAIVADIGLPGMNGTEFCAYARSHPSYRDTPILFLTGADSVQERAASSLSGGTEFITKPFDTAELSLKVETWTLRHQLHLV